MTPLLRTSIAALTSLALNAATEASEKNNDLQQKRPHGQVVNIEPQAKDKHFHGLFAGAEIAASGISAAIHNHSQSNTSLSYGGFAGYRHQTQDGWVIGVEAALGDRRGNLALAQTELDFNYLWSGSATVGRVFGEHRDHLIYGKIGVGGIQARMSINNTLLMQHNYKGVQSTVGYERSLSPRIGLRIEASYNSYDPGFDHIQSKFGFVYKF